MEYQKFIYVFSVHISRIENLEKHKFLFKLSRLWWFYCKHDCLDSISNAIRNETCPLDIEIVFNQKIARVIGFFVHISRVENLEKHKFLFKLSRLWWFYCKHDCLDSISNAIRNETCPLDIEIVFNQKIARVIGFFVHISRVENLEKHKFLFKLSRL